MTARATPAEVDQFVHGVEMLRTQLFNDHLTIAGMQAAHTVLSVWRPRVPKNLLVDCEWVLAQLDAALMMCELDSTNGEVAS